MYFINGRCSFNETISFGVPQGSISFIILIMFNVSQLLFTLLFADDRNVFTIRLGVSQLIAIMNNELAKGVEWSNVNKLSLNVKNSQHDY